MHINSRLCLIDAEPELPKLSLRILQFHLLHPIGLIDLAERGNLVLEQIRCQPTDPAFS